MEASKLERLEKDRDQKSFEVPPYLAQFGFEDEKPDQAVNCYLWLDEDVTKALSQKSLSRDSATVVFWFSFVTPFGAVAGDFFSTCCRQPLEVIELSTEENLILCVRCQKEIASPTVNPLVYGLLERLLDLFSGESDVPTWRALEDVFRAWREAAGEDLYTASLWSTLLIQRILAVREDLLIGWNALPRKPWRNSFFADEKTLQESKLLLNSILRSHNILALGELDVRFNEQEDAQISGTKGLSVFSRGERFSKS